MRKVLLGMVVMLLSASFYCYGMEPVNDGNLNRDVELFQISQKYWNLNEILLNSQSSSEKSQLEQKFNQESSNYSKLVKEISEKLLKGWNSNDEYVQHFSQVYKSLPPEGRKAFYPALEALRNEIAINSMNTRDSAMSRFEEYFPGYGYGEPGFIYRKGKEVLREARGTTWQDESQTVTSNLNVSLTVNLDILNMLKSWLGLGHIGNLIVNKEFKMDFNGAPMIVFNVSFTLNKTITTRMKRKFEINRIWFELYKAPQTWNPANAKWELIGKTYEILQDPTGDEFVVDMTPPAPASSTPQISISDNTK
ncbi:MAG: hypothetical protein HQM08_07950 [Candidatus Riflebacteria bacterium]|nr:hypothetical protein [Candidatus Riflebacteria bacterium]